MEFIVNDFHGPLDVLLSLIKDSEFDICDIPIIELTDQYLNFINGMEEANLSIASEYLVMASELMYMKSKALVPNALDDEELCAAKEELTNRLIEYKKYKEMAPQFHDLEEKRKDIFTKAPSSLKDYSEGVLLSDNISLQDLLNAFQRFMERKNYSKPVSTKITSKEYSIDERVNDIKNILRVKKRVEFFDLFDSFSKPYVVVTFLSILEMAKKNEIRITQENNFDKIYCEGI